MTYTELLATSPKGWRLRRVGEIVLAGDLQPSGPIWEPVDEYLIGTEVAHCCYHEDGSPDFIMGKRKRRKAKLPK